MYTLNKIGGNMNYLNILEILNKMDTKILDVKLTTYAKIIKLD